MEVAHEGLTAIRRLRSHSARSNDFRRPRPCRRLFRYDRWNIVSHAGCGRLLARSFGTSPADLLRHGCVELTVPTRGLASRGSPTAGVISYLPVQTQRTPPRKATWDP